MSEQTKARPDPPSSADPGRARVSHEPGAVPADVERLWYDAYVRELGVAHPCADHGSKRVRDPLAATGHLLVARSGDGRVAGTCLVSKGGTADLGFYAELFGIRADDPSCSVTTKLVVAKWARKSRTVIDVASAAYEHGLRSGLEVDYADAQPSRVPFFKRLGYRVLPGASEHPHYGRSIRLRLDLQDTAHLESVGSPFMRVRRRVLQEHA